VLRGALVGLALGAGLVAPLALAHMAGGPRVFAAASAEGAAAALELVGWVLAPQLVLALAVLGLALHKLVSRAAGLGAAPTPSWVDPAVESALLLGMLGTLSGMVRGFVGLSPEQIEPGPLVHALGTALRSSFVGFGIALVGVWTKQRRVPS
jgi:hypothetical protein